METIFEKVSDICDLKNFAGNTKESYIRQIKHFFDHFDYPALELGTEEIRQYLLFLKRERKFASRTLGVVYSAGLRSREAVSLKVKDIDSKRMQVFIRNSKGAKDRYSILAKSTLCLLRQYWKIYRPNDWLFPGRDANHHMRYKGICYFFKKYKMETSIMKRFHRFNIKRWDVSKCAELPPLEVISISATNAIMSGYLIIPAAIAIVPNANS